MFTQLKIARLKRKARRHHEAYTNYEVGDAGAAATNFISGGVLSHHANQFNQTLDQLDKLDPEFTVTKSMYLDTLQ